MLFSEIMAFVVAGIALVASPGPATLSLAAAGAAFETRDARVYLFGIMSGASIVIVGVAAGLLTAILSVPHAATVLTMVSLAYLGYLAYRIATAVPVEAEGRASVAPGYLTGLLFNFSNPKAYAAFAALFAGFDLLPGTPFLSAVTEAAICFVIVVVADIAWLFIGSTLRRYLHDRRKSRIINISFAILLVLSVIPALTVLR
jgi:threonine/homoserine/homoserine lactone efflux protein